MSGTPTLELRDVRKTFGGITALRRARLVTRAGTIHGIVGPNGAGKSTLIRIATGQMRPNGGEVVVKGRTMVFSHTSDALAAGVAAMPQELTIVPSLSVAENLCLGCEPRRFGFQRPSATRARARALLSRMGVSIDVDRLAGDLDPAEQRIVMFGRALNTGAHTLILDEPTAALSAVEAEVFLRVVEGMRDAGVSIIYISHRFGEIVRLSSRVTLLRDGETVGLLQGDEITEEALVRAVLTEGAVIERIPRRRTAPAAGREITATGLTGRSLAGVDLAIRPGEVLGLCGLPGSGVSELMEILGGVRRPAAGRIVIDDAERQFREPADALAVGLAYLPVERARASLQEMSIRANLVVSSLDRVSRGGFVTAARERAFGREVMTGLGLFARMELPLRSLSGGNRQKVLLSRCLLASSRVLLLDDPTVGVDVKARHEIHAMLARFADEGRAVVVAVSEPEELVSLADRVLAFSRGRITRELAGDQITSAALLRAVTSEGR